MLPSDQTKIKAAVERILREHKFNDYLWMHPSDVVVSHWVRMKCLIDCEEFGQNASCPPNVPSVLECEAFFREYSEAIVLHFEKAVQNPEDRFARTRQINNRLIHQVERDVFRAGFHKAFLLPMDSCNLCDDCTGVRQTCKNPKLARPIPESMAVDVFTTVRKIGYPIQVLSDYD